MLRCSWDFILISYVVKVQGTPLAKRGQASLVRKYVDCGSRWMCLVGGDGATTSGPAVGVGVYNP